MFSRRRIVPSINPLDQVHEWDQLLLQEQVHQELALPYERVQQLVGAVLTPLPECGTALVFFSETLLFDIDLSIRISLLDLAVFFEDGREYEVGKYLIY